MAIEVVGALAIGALVFWLVLVPMLRRGGPTRYPPEPVAEEETRRGVALLALKEIEFDRATGKLSDADYAMLKARYSAEALAALAADHLGEPGAAADPEELISARLSQLRSAASSGSAPPPPCPSCGPRTEPDALFCSSCGRPLQPAAFCNSCGSQLGSDSRFCASCGTRVAA